MPRLNTILVVLVLMLGVGMRVAFFTVSVLRVPPAMDECITALQSKQIIESKDSVAAQAKLYPPPLLGRFPLLFMTQPYLFPLEAYLNTPFIGWLPRNALGIRTMPALLAALSVLLSILVIRKWGRLRDIWPGLLLILLPSGYLLMLQAGYAPPGYASFLCLSALVVYLAQCYRDGEGTVRLLLLAGILGFCSGLAVASQMIAVPMFAAAAGMVVADRRWRKTLLTLPTFGIGAALGFAPYPLGKILYPGAHDVVSGVRTVGDTVGRVWELILRYSLPTAMGFRSCLFPDGEERLDMVPGVEAIFPYLWLAIAGAALLLSLWAAGRTLVQQRRLNVRTSDLFVVISWGGLLLFAVSSRAYSGSFRYLLGVVWAFPFLITHLYLRAGRRVRFALGGVAVACAILNVVTGCALIKTWSEAGFAAKEPHIYDLKPAIQYLEERGITRCYANYFDTYRINYMTDERILCSQHYNFRFHWWPLPYKEAVDASTNVAYVLGPAFRFPPEELEAGLEALQVDFTKTLCGDASVYTDFSARNQPAEHQIPSSLLRVNVASNPDEAGYLVDGDYNTRWRSLKPQASGMSVSVVLPTPLPVSRVMMYYNSYYHDHAERMNILARSGNVWTAAATNVAWDLEHFEMINGHPVYGSVVHSMRFGPVTAEEIRIEVSEPLVGRDWSFGEVRLFASGVAE